MKEKWLNAIAVWWTPQIDLWQRGTDCLQLEERGMLSSAVDCLGIWLFPPLPQSVTICPCCSCSWLWVSQALHCQTEEETPHFSSLLLPDFCWPFWLIFFYPFVLSSYLSPSPLWIQFCSFLIFGQLKWYRSLSSLPIFFEVWHAFITQS